MKEEHKSLNSAVESVKIEGKNFTEEEMKKLVEAHKNKTSADSFLFYLVKKYNELKEEQENGRKK